jgi:hypothetical protein
MSEQEVLDEMDRIQNEIKLSHNNAEDGRYSWPDRWVALRRSLEHKMSKGKPTEH